MDDGPQAFAYHRAVAPLLWVLVAVAGVELAVVHLLLALFAGRTAALAVSLVSVGGIAWLVATIRGFRTRPVTLDGRTLVWRVGTLRRLDVPVTSIAGPVATFDAALLKRRDTANMALVAYPNVVLAIDPPLPGRRGPIVRIAHRLDAPAAFLRALEVHLAARSG